MYKNESGGRVKRHNIYLYKYNSDEKGKNVGFCRMDISGGNIKIFVNIREELLGICREEIAEKKAFILKKSGEKQEFKLDTRCVCVEYEGEIVGLAVIYTKMNGIKIKVQGLLENRCFEDKPENSEQHNQKLEEDEFVKIALEDITILPRNYWHFSKNKFLVCGYKKYGYLAYTKKEGRYIICVPGIVDDNVSVCARKHGFKSFLPIKGEEDQDMGYWMMN